MPFVPWQGTWGNSHTRSMALDPAGLAAWAASPDGDDVRKAAGHEMEDEPEEGGDEANEQRLLAEAAVRDAIRYHQQVWT